MITCYQLSLLTQSSCFGLWARSHKRGGTEHKKSLFSACEFIWLCSAFFCTVQHPSGVTWIQLNRLHVAICMTFKACFKLKESLNAHDLFPDHGMCSALAVMTCHIKESACVVTLNTLALGSTYLPHSLISLYRRDLSPSAACRETVFTIRNKAMYYSCSDQFAVLFNTINAPLAG